MRLKKPFLQYFFFALIIIIATVAVVKLFYYKQEEKKLYSLKHFFPSEKITNSFNGQKIAKEFDERVFADYKIDGSQSDKTVFSQIDETINHSNNPHPKDVIKVYMNDKCSYGEIVSLINMAQIHQIKRYLLFDNSFYYVVEAR